MLKKLVIAGVLGFVAVSALAGTRIGAKIEAAGKRVEERITSLFERDTSKIPDDKDVAHLRRDVKALDKDIRTVIDQVAKERVEVNQLKEKVTDLRAQQSKDKELLTARAAAIKNANENVIFGHRTLSVAAAKAELEDGVRRYSSNQKSLEAMELALGSREKVRDGLEKQLDAMKNQKSELTATIDALEAEMTALKLQQMESKYQTDDTRLARIKEDIRAIRTKLEVEREKLKLMPAAFDPAPTPASNTKSVDDIMAPLAGQAKPDVKVPVVE